MKSGNVVRGGDHYGLVVGLILYALLLMAGAVKRLLKIQLEELEQTRSLAVNPAKIYGTSVVCMFFPQLSQYNFLCLLIANIFSTSYKNFI